MNLNLGAGRERALTLEQLRTFYAVAMSGGVTNAVDIVNKSQPAITQNIKSLESIIGSELFVRRRGHYYGLTDSGKKLLKYATLILESASNALKEINALSSLQILRIGVPLDFGAETTTILRAELGRVFPNTAVEIMSAFGKAQRKLLADHKLDIAVIREPEHSTLKEKEKEIADSDVKYEKLLWIGENKSRSKFKKGEIVDLVLFPEGCIFREAVIETIIANEAHYRVIYESSSYSDVIFAAEKGLGITAIPESCVHERKLSLLIDDLPLLPRVKTTICYILEDPIVSKSIEIIKRLYFCRYNP